MVGCLGTGHGRSPGGLESLEAAKHAFLDSWTKHAGDNFTLDHLASVVDTTGAFVSFDAMSRDKTVVRGYAQYAAIWAPGMAAFKTARLSEVEDVHVWLSEDMAVTASIVRIEGEMLDGTKLDVPGHLTLAWRRDGSTWRAVHEHMSLGVKL
jgi:ketosteroid isomerase-like protein